MDFQALKDTDILSNIKKMKTVEDCNEVGTQVTLFCKANPKLPSATALRSQYNRISTAILEKAGQLTLARDDAKEVVEQCRKDLKDKKGEEVIAVLKKCRNELSKYSKSWIEDAWDSYNKLSAEYHPMHQDKKAAVRLVV